MTLRQVARRVVPKKVRRRLRRRAVRMGGLRRVTPVSPDFGVYRGTPVDRHYIEDFIERHDSRIRGRVLEIGEQLYVRERGAFAARGAGGPLPPVRSGVDQVDILDLAASNPQATIVADLNDPKAAVPTDAFDCVICTQTLQFVYDVPAALRTLRQALKPGGTLLMTVPGISQIVPVELIQSPGITGADYPGGRAALLDYWRFTPSAAERLCSDEFGQDGWKVESFGNVLAAVAFLHGLAADDLRPGELGHNDPAYPLLIAITVFR